MSRSTRWMICGAVGAALVLPAAAEAATRTVTMGLPAADQTTFQRKYSADVNDYFPHGTTINVGDSVKFVPTGFHDINLPKKGGGIVEPFIPTGKKVTGINDEAGAPFWFNGQPAFGFNPVMFKSGFGKTFTYTGAKTVLSGLPISNKPKPITVRFAKAGLFRYLCDLHAGMTGTVRVLPRGKGVPSAAGHAKRVKAQVAAALAVAKSAIAKAKLPANTVAAGLQGAHGVHTFAFVPDKLEVATGTTVTFVSGAKANEPHTATTGPGDPDKEPKSYLGILAASFEGPAPDPRAIYPSDPPPAGPAVLTTALHGNAFWNSGSMDGVAASPDPLSSSVKVGEAGTYEFYCIIHPFMHMTITAK